MKIYVVIAGSEYIPDVIYAGTDREKAFENAGANITPDEWHVETDVRKIKDYDPDKENNEEIFFAQEIEGSMENYTSIQIFSDKEATAEEPFCRICGNTTNVKDGVCSTCDGMRPALAKQGIMLTDLM